jgi:hypothetical protein
LGPSAWRYESTRTPQGKMLAKLARLAIESGFDEEAHLFLDLLFKELGFTPFQLADYIYPLAKSQRADIGCLRRWCAGASTGCLLA